LLAGRMMEVVVDRQQRTAAEVGEGPLSVGPIAQLRDRFVQFGQGRRLVRRQRAVAMAMAVDRSGQVREDLVLVDQIVVSVLGGHGRLHSSGVVGQPVPPQQGGRLLSPRTGVVAFSDRQRRQLGDQRPSRCRRTRPSEDQRVSSWMLLQLSTSPKATE
jgi:hypothetical protein